jgi:hypothetical protein
MDLLLATKTQRVLAQRVLALRQLCLNHYPAKANGSCLLASPGIEENMSTDEDCYKWQWARLAVGSGHGSHGADAGGPFKLG